MEALYTPGHTMGSVSFEVTAGDYRLLIAGTLFGAASVRKSVPAREAWRETLDKITSRHYEFLYLRACEIRS